jgi:hypothetical protein
VILHVTVFDLLLNCALTTNKISVLDATWKAASFTKSWTMCGISAVFELKGGNLNGHADVDGRTELAAKLDRKIFNSSVA